MRTFNGLLVWFVSTLFVIYAFCLNTAAAVFSDAVKVSLGLTDMQATYAVGAFTIGFALMQIPAGYLLDRFNTKYILSFGVLLMALGNICISFTSDLMFFSLANFMQGAGGSFAFIGSGIVIARWFPPRAFPILFGLTQTMSCVLTGVIHYVFKTALETHPWNYIYKDLSVFGAILLVATFLLVRVPADGKKTEPVSFKKALGLVCTNSQIWLSTIAAATTFGVLLAYGGFWYLSVQNFYSVPSGSALILSAIIFAGIGVGTPMLGWASNLFRSRKLVIHMTLVLGNMVLLLGLYLPHYEFGGFILIDVISFFIGFFLSGSMLFYTVVSELSTDSTRGVALSVTNTGVFLFNTALMFIPYFFITENSKNFFTYLWVLPFCVLISILLTYFIKETYTEQVDA